MDRVEEPIVSVSSDKAKEHTPAYAGFDCNTDKLFHLLQFISTAAWSFRGELDTKVAPEAMSIAKEIAQISRPQDNDASDQETINKDNLVQKLLDTLKPIPQFLDGFQTVREWIPVLLVTTVEAYLKDVLIYAAKVDPWIMESKAKVPYANVLKTQSLDHLKEELKEKLPPEWARNFMDDGGPKSWIDKLTKMGARGYRRETAKDMETLWGVRHLLVHSVGVATPDFVRRHPEVGVKAGETILIRSNQLTAWIEVAYHFVNVTDSYFVQRYRAGMVSPD